MMNGSNRHPVDELADVRAQIKELKMREHELREMIAGKICDGLGEEYYAEIVDVSSSALDQAALKEQLGMERLKPFMRPMQYQMVKVKPRFADPDAI